MVTKLNDDHSNAAQVLAECAALDEAYASAAELPAERYNRDLLTLVQAVREALKDRVILTWGGEELRDALEQFEPWLEEDDDPRKNGWVDDKGRP